MAPLKSFNPTLYQVPKEPDSVLLSLASTYQIRKYTAGGVVSVAAISLSSYIHSMLISMQVNLDAVLCAMQQWDGTSRPLILGRKIYACFSHVCENSSHHIVQLLLCLSSTGHRLSYSQSRLLIHLQHGYGRTSPPHARDRNPRHHSPG